MHPAAPDPAGGRPLAREAREDFAAWVAEEPAGRDFAQARLWRAGTGGYEIRHAEDAGRPAEELALREDPRQAREIAKLTEDGQYRPLKSSPNLRRGWLLRLADQRELSTAMSYLYPAALVHWHLERRGELPITHYRENAARQSGIYERIQKLTGEGVQKAAAACCDDAVCLKRTLWDVDESQPLEMHRGEGEIPCPEPCSVFVSFARRIRVFEREQERDLEDPSQLTDSEREDLAALAEAAASGAVEFAREAEFEEPLNERRLRYRSQTLVPKLRVRDKPGEDG